MTDLLQADVQPMTNAAEPGCVFCPQNGKVDIVCEVGGMYLVHAKDEAMQDLLDRWLIIPADHAETLEDLPLGWGESLAEIVHEVNLWSGLNLSLNMGAAAGQTMPHLHWWLLDRSTDDLGKGMSWMITELIRVYAVNRRLTAENERLRQVSSHQGAPNVT